MVFRKPLGQALAKEPEEEEGKEASSERNRRRAHVMEIRRSRFQESECTWEVLPGIASVK